ncbi:MAG TPA: DNA primase [Vicinamibacteria bacterium]|nr:DNA primase [Vicinamibacteria bacterium]
MGFPDSFIDEVRRTADIVRLVGDHVQLRKAGTSWKGLCPFHNEKTPSFNVSPERGRFHCFGCGEGGDVFRFVMLREKATFPEAVETVARRFGIQVPERRTELTGERKEKEEILAALQDAADHFEKRLWSPAGTKARDYLLGRGFEQETLQKIKAGAAADSWTDLWDALRAKHQPARILAAGLAIEGQEGKRPYDRFRNRVIFPILSDSGRVVGFGARSLDGSEPKYLNSPESPVYHKGHTLYGLFWAKDSIRREGRVVLMEGYLDVAKAIEAGVTEAVATCGTALTGGHAKLIRRFAPKVIVNFDGDDAGRKAAKKSLEPLVEEGLAVHVLELPGGHDPDTFIKEQGAESYRALLDEAPVYMDWLIAQAAREHDVTTPAGKAAFLEALLPFLSRIPSSVERMAWTVPVARAGKLDEIATRDEIRRAAAAAGKVAAKKVDGEALVQSVTVVRKVQAKPLPAERMLLALLASGAEDAAEALGELDEGDLARLVSGEVLRAARDRAASGRPVTVEALEQELGEEARRVLSAAAVEPPPPNVDPRECVREIRRLPLRARMDEIQRDLARAEGPAQEALLQEKLELVRRMASL